MHCHAVLSGPVGHATINCSALIGMHSIMHLMQLFHMYMIDYYPLALYDTCICIPYCLLFT
jgi:hypothetical protein